MTYRYDPDDVIATWAAESIGGGGPNYLPEVLRMVERTPQHRLARWVPTSWTISPSRAPIVRPRVVLVATLTLLALVAAGALAAGSLSRPTFKLQSVTPIPGAVGAIFGSPSDDAIWTTVPGGVVRVDPVTGETRVLAIPGTASDLTGVVEHDGVLWVADYPANRVIRVDPVTGVVTTQIDDALKPFMLGWEHGTWAVASGLDELFRIDANGNKDLTRDHVIAAAVVPGAVWYIEGPLPGAHAVELDPATGVERQRIAVPSGVAAGIAIDAQGNPWLSMRRSDRSTILALDAASGKALGGPFDVPYDVIGGLVAGPDSMWALPAPSQVDGSQLVELSPSGPTGRVQPIAGGIDPDGGMIAFGSLWIVSESDGSLYRYPVDALAP